MFGGCVLETGQQVRVVEYYDTATGEWEEDFRLRKGRGEEGNMSRFMIDKSGMVFFG